MAKGKWAQGIQPRQFSWVIKEQLAVCERPGGYGTNHRRVRRQEEVLAPLTSAERRQLDQLLQKLAEHTVGLSS